MVNFFTRQIEQKDQSFTTPLTFGKLYDTKNDFKSLKPRINCQLNNVVDGVMG